jgi:hypothetical protein
MTEARDPGVRQVVFELLAAAPAPPPFPTSVEAVTEARAAERSRPRRLRVIGALVAVALVIGTAAIALLAGRNTSSPAPPTVAHAPGHAANVAFVDRRGLVVRASGSTRDVVVASGAVSAPRWSPSGKWLAYRQNSGLYVVRADGSHRQGLTGDAGPNYLSDTYKWSPTVDALAVPFGQAVLVTWFSGDVFGGTRIFPPADGIKAERSAQSVAWSNDGRSLAISMTGRTSAGPGVPVSSLWLAPDLCNPSARQLCADPSRLLRLPYTPGRNEYPILLAGFAFHDRYLLISPDDIGSSSVALDGLPLKAVPINGGRTLRIGGTLIRNGWVQSSPTGSQLVVVRSNGRMVTDPRTIVVCDAPARCHALVPGPDVQTLDPSWSPDGSRIAFVREAHGSSSPPVTSRGIDWTVKYRTRRLWIVNADGSHAYEVTAAGGGVADPHFSPDGSSIVFVRDARLRQIDLATNRVTTLSGSMRATATACTASECLPDAAVYETDASWSDHEAVNFGAAKP